MFNESNKISEPFLKLELHSTFFRNHSRAGSVSIRSQVGVPGRSDVARTGGREFGRQAVFLVKWEVVGGDSASKR